MPQKLGRHQLTRASSRWWQGDLQPGFKAQAVGAGSGSRGGVPKIKAEPPLPGKAPHFRGEKAQEA